MSDVSQGLGWWQASDLKWYPPERHPDYVPPPPPPPADDVTEAGGQAAGTLAGPPPQALPVPSPDTQTVVVQMPAVSHATVKDAVAKLSVTAWLLFGGFVIAAVGIFFPWQTVSYNAAGLGDLGSNNSALAGGARFAVLLIIAVAVWLAWPARSGSKMSVKRLTGLAMVVFLLVGVFVLGFYGVSDNNRVNAGSGEDFSAGFGLLVYTAAVIAVVVGTVRVWMQRSRTEELAS
jgi:hypothetical protein